MEPVRGMKLVKADSEKILHFMDIYCTAHHGEREKTAFEFNYPKVPVRLEEDRELCGECTRLAKHAVVKRYQCPLDPKPKCRTCPEHCYRPQYREAMEVVMRFVGPRLLFKR